MKTDRALIFGSGVFLTIIFVLVLLASKFSSIYLLMAACLAVVILIFVLLAIYLRADHMRNLKAMTHELIGITHGLEESDYSHYPEESADFYRALSTVKQCFLQREHLRKEILEIAHHVALNMEFDKTLRELMPKLAELTGSNCCAFYAVSNVSRLSLKHSIGFGKNVYSEFDLSIGEGFIGSFAMKKEISVVYDIPDDTIYTVRTFLGKIKPRNVMVVPIFHQEQLNGVLVCASIKAYNEENTSIAEMLRYYLGVAVGNGINTDKNKRLTNELAFQNKLIQNQHEEMKKRLSHKEKLIYHLLNTSDCTYMLDAEYKVLHWCDSAKKIHGLSKEEAKGRSIDQLYTSLGLAPVEEFLKEISQKETNTHEYCTWTTNKNGSKTRYEINFTQLPNNLGTVAKVKELG